METASPESFSPCSLNDTMAAYELPLLGGLNFPLRPLAPNHSWGYVLTPTDRVAEALKGKGPVMADGEATKGAPKGAPKGAKKGGVEDSETMTAQARAKDPAPVNISDPVPVPVNMAAPAPAPVCAPTPALVPARAPIDGSKAHPPKCPPKPPPTFLDFVCVTEKRIRKWKSANDEVYLGQVNEVSREIRQRKKVGVLPPGASQFTYRSAQGGHTQGNDPSSSSSATGRCTYEDPRWTGPDGYGNRGRSQRRVKRDQPAGREKKLNRDLSRFMRTGDYVYDP